MYETELSLVDDLTKILKSSWPNVPIGLKFENQILLREVNLGYGVADIVMSEFRSIPHKRERFLNSSEAKMLNIINENPGITVDRIIDTTKVSKRKVMACISSLVEFEFAKFKEDKISPWKDYVNTVKHSIAIEVKLRNWKRALKQAYRYKWFSDQSFVCLPCKNIKPAIRNLDMFKSMGVGLIEVCGGNEINLLYSPPSQAPYSKEMSIMLNEVVLNQIYAS